LHPLIAYSEGVRVERSVFGVRNVIQTVRSKKKKTLRNRSWVRGIEQKTNGKTPPHHLEDNLSKQGGKGSPDKKHANKMRHHGRKTGRYRATRKHSTETPDFKRTKWRLSRLVNTGYACAQAQSEQSCPIVAHLQKGASPIQKEKPLHTNKPPS